LRLKRSQPFCFSVCVVDFFLFVQPQPRPVHSTVLGTSTHRHRIQTPGSAKRNSHISQARARVASRLVRPSCAPRCSARHHTLRVYGSPARECRATKSRRHAAIARAAQTHKIAVAELQRRHRFAERQLKPVARIRAPEHAGRSTAPALAAPVQSQASVSLVVRGVGRRSSGRHRRAADKRLLLPVIWLVAKRNQARTADSERKWHTQQVSAFRRGAGAGAPDAHEKGRARRSTTRCHSTSCRTLGTLAHYSYTHC
jgi:hypothetical protein